MLATVRFSSWSIALLRSGTSTQPPNPLRIGFGLPRLDRGPHGRSLELRCGRTLRTAHALPAPPGAEHRTQDSVLVVKTVLAVSPGGPPGVTSDRSVGPSAAVRGARA